MISCPTRAVLQAATRDLLEDANQGRSWKNWQINAAINAALQDVHKKIIDTDRGWFERVVSMGLTANVGMYTLPSDISRIQSVELFTGSGSEQPIQLVRAWANQLLRRTLTGTPVYYFLIGRRQIGVYPIPSSTRALDTNETGPLRITYIERVPRFVELDHPISFEEQTNAAGANVDNEYLTLDIAHQVFQGPAVSYDVIKVLADTSFMPIRMLKLVTFFAKRDKTKSRYAPPDYIGMPWQSGMFSSLFDNGTDDTASQKVSITQWPLGDPDNSQWPTDATHLEIWLYVSGKSTDILNGRDAISGNNFHDMCYLGNILPTDDWADGPIIFNALGGATIPLGPGDEGAGIWDGRYTENIAAVGTGVIAGSFFETTYNNRWINQIPPTPYPHFERWAPYDVDSPYVSAPNTGSGIYHDTNPAKGDSDIVHEDFFDDHVHTIGALAAINVLSRHDFANKLLIARRTELLDDLKNYYATRDRAPRVINVTQPDSNTIPRHRPTNHPDMRR